MDFVQISQKLNLWAMFMLNSVIFQVCDVNIPNYKIYVCRSYDFLSHFLNSFINFVLIKKQCSKEHLMNTYMYEIFCNLISNSIRFLELESTLRFMYLIIKIVCMLREYLSVCLSVY